MTAALSSSRTLNQTYSRTHPLVIVLLLLALTCTSQAHAVSKLELDTRVDAALQRLYAKQPEARNLGAKAVAIMVFPRLMKVGLGVGGEMGEGSLLLNGQPSRYYRNTSLSLGFQMGIQARSEVIMFMTQLAYEDFVNNDGWEAGVDGSIALIEFGIGREIDTRSIRDPIIAFVFNNKGLMYNLSLEGAKFWQITK